MKGTVKPEDVIVNHIEIWERWQVIDGTVYYEWKTPKDKDWHRKVTAHKETPWVQRSFLTQNQYEYKLKSHQAHREAGD